MDDRQGQFLIAVGDLCTAAGLASLEVQVLARGDGGGVARGVPRLRLPDGAADEVGATGYARTLVVGGRIIPLEDLAECTIYAPDAADPG